MPPTDNLDKLSWTQGDKTGTCVATNARGLVASLRAGGANVFDGVRIDMGGGGGGDEQLAPPGGDGGGVALDAQAASALSALEALLGGGVAA